VNEKDTGEHLRLDENECFLVSKPMEMGATPFVFFGRSMAILSGVILFDPKPFPLWELMRGTHVNLNLATRTYRFLF